MGGHLGYLHFLAITNPATNFCVNTFSFLFGKYLRVELLGHIGHKWRDLAAAATAVIYEIHVMLLAVDFFKYICIEQGQSF